MKIISAVHEKGGSAKTSSIVHLAYAKQRELNETNDPTPVIFLDLDPRETGASWLGGAGVGTEELTPGKVFVPIFRKRDLENVTELIALHIEQQYPDAFLFIDTPANDKSILFDVAQNSDFCVVPVLVGGQGRTMIGETIRTLQNAKNANPDMNYRILIVGHDYNRRKVTERTVEALADQPIFETRVPNRNVLIDAHASVPAHESYDAVYAELMEAL